jgi:hypothetical protein
MGIGGIYVLLTYLVSPYPFPYPYIDLREMFRIPLHFSLTLKGAPNHP